MPYQVFGARAGALALMIAWIRLAMARSGSGISAIAASTAFSSFAPRASAFSSRAYAFAAARSSALQPLGVLPFAAMLLADLFVAAFFTVFLSGMAVYLLRLSQRCLDADVVACGIAEGAVASPVRLVNGLLDDLGSAGLQLLEDLVEVGGGQKDPAVRPFGHHLGDGSALLLGDAGVGGRRRQEDGRTGLADGPDRDPAHLAASDVAADLEAEGVAVEGQGGLRVVVREKAGVNRDVHGGSD